MSRQHDYLIFAGNANRDLALATCAKIQQNLNLDEPIELGKATVDTFSDGEVEVELHENVRGKDVFVIQSTNQPANNLIELLLLIDALKRSSVASVTAIIPYFGYSRQDRRIRSVRAPIAAKVFADTITAAGADRVVNFDLHAEQIQGFFSIPVDNIYSTALFANYVETTLINELENSVIVSPDVGGVVRARALAKNLGQLPLAFVDKRRTGPNEVEVTQVVGDVDGKVCLVIDDIVDSARTLCRSAEILKATGAKKVITLITHPVLSGPAYEELKNSCIDMLVVTDSLKCEEKFLALPNFSVISLADLVASSIMAIKNNGSIKKLF